MKLKLNIWKIYFFSKFIYMYLALNVYSKFTSLGDTYRYLNGTPFELRSFLSTDLMDFLAGTLSFYLGIFFANVPFVILAFFGVYYPISKIDLNKNQLITLLLLLSFPNFGIWTSIASKESIAVFYMGLILGFLIDLIKGNSNKNYLFFFLGIFLCWVFKAQYLIPVLAVLVFILIHNWLKLKNSEDLVIFLLIIIFSILSLYIYRYEINELSLQMPEFFSFESNSTRENTFFLNDFDIFRNAPYGMFIAFFGPTINEAQNKIPHLLVFYESMLLLFTFLFSISKSFKISLASKEFNFYYIGIFFIFLFWILFVHYPFGVLNPGSANRYRQGFYSSIVILYYFLYTENIKNILKYKKK